MNKRFAGARRVLSIMGMLATGVAPVTAHAQARWYASALGPDTLSLERFERSGNTITGLWVTFHSGGDRHREILCHEYTITVADDGRPRSVHLQVRHPDSTVLRTYDVRLTDDSVVATTEPVAPGMSRVAAARAFPQLGMTMAMWELIVSGARSGKRTPDSTAVVVVPVTGPFVARPVPVALLSANATRVGPPGGPTVFTGRGGAIDSLAEDGNALVRQVGAFDIDAIARAASQSVSSPAAGETPPPAAGTPLPPELEGKWRGTLAAGGQQLRLEITFGRAADGTATATLVSVDQPGGVIPFSTVTITGNDIRLLARAISAEYRGTLGPDGTITGQWTQGPRTAALNLTRAAPKSAPSGHVR